MTGDGLHRVEGPVEQLPLSDWTDQDLLTKDQARERLTMEIGRTKARLAELWGLDAESEIALLTKRLNAMESMCGEYDAYLHGT